MDLYFNETWIEEQQQQLATRRRREHSTSTDRPRIAVLITGGTIGMIEREDGQIGPPDGIDELEAEYAHLSPDFDVEWVQLANLDSANVGPVEWRRFAIEIHRQLQKEFVGVVVAHGTDTLAYTASAVAFALGRDLSKPVVFTGSQTTVDQVHGDARTNLFRACMVAAQPNLPEVVIVFGEHIYRAVRAVKRDDRRFDAFESFLYPILGMVGETVELQSEVIRPSSGEPLPGLSATFDDGIVVISQHPGLVTSFFETALENESTRPSGLIIQTLGAGNIPTNDPYDLSTLIKSATRRRIPVLLASQYPVHPGNLGRYLPSRRAIDAGAIPIANMTMAAILTKLSWVLGQAGEALNHGAIQTRMLNNYVGEIDQRDAAALKRAVELADRNAPVPRSVTS